MLPAFPTAQKILDAAYMKRVLAAKAHVFPHLVHPPVRPIIEGKHSDFQREDRQVKPLNVKRQQVTTTFDAKDGKGMRGCKPKPPKIPSSLVSGFYRLVQASF